MPSNIIIGAAFNYKKDTIYPFIASLRKVFDGKVVLLTKDIDIETHELYKKFQIDIYDVEDQINFDYINVMRFELFHRYLTKVDSTAYDKVLIADTRDIVFQSDPFNNTELSNIYFYSEPELIGACETNSSWYKQLYGDEGLSVVKNKLIVCGGTILGKKKSIVNFIEVLWSEIVRLVQAGKAFGTCDQAVINYLAHNIMNECLIERTFHSNVATLHHAKRFTFNSSGQLLNASGIPTPVIHQYDRHVITQKIFQHQI
jgi:hypothetical protein